MRAFRGMASQRAWPPSLRCTLGPFFSLPPPFALARRLDLLDMC